MTPIQITVGQFGYAWWDLVPAVVGGILGALAGGIPAWLLANRSSKESLVREKIARKEVELIAVFRLHTKLGMMINDLSSTLIQIREMLKRPVDPRDESPTQRKISAFAGKNLLPDSALSADDLVIFVSVNELDYLTELDLFSRRYVADMIALDTYGSLKADLHDLVSDSEVIRFGQADIVSTSTTGSSANKLRMKARTLESLIVPLIEMMERDLRAGLQLACQFDLKLKPHFLGKKCLGSIFESSKFTYPTWRLTYLA